MILTDNYVGIARQSENNHSVKAKHSFQQYLCGVISRHRDP